MEKEEQDYRNLLISTQHQLNDSYDKLVITLSGGALALSMTFLKDVVSFDQVTNLWMLFLSWCFFIISMASIFGEILFGLEAYKKALKQFDGGTMKSEKVGGIFSFLTRWFSRAAAISLILGLLTISVFIYLNLENKNGTKTTTAPSEATQQAHTTTAKAATTAGSPNSKHGISSGEGLGATTSSEEIVGFNKAIKFVPATKSVASTGLPTRCFGIRLWRR